MCWNAQERRSIAPGVSATLSRETLPCGLVKNVSRQGDQHSRQRRSHWNCGCLCAARKLLAQLLCIGNASAAPSGDLRPTSRPCAGLQGGARTTHLHDINDERHRY